MVILIICCLGLYWPSLQNSMVWDDLILIREQASFVVPHLWLNALSEPLPFSVNYYRPLVVATFLFDVHVLGGSDYVFHLTNVLIHSATTGLFFLVAKELIKRSGCAGRYWPILISLLYGVSPVLTEVVLWVSGRFDLIISFLLVFFLLIDLKLLGAKKYWILGLVYFMMACSKEAAFTLAVLFPLWHLFVARLGSSRAQAWGVWLCRENVTAYIAIITAGTCYLALRYLMLGALIVPEALGDSGLYVGINAVLLIFSTLGGYCLSVVSYAGNVSPVYPLPNTLSWIDLNVWVGLFTFGLTSCLLLFQSLWGLALLMFIITLLPVLNILPLPIAGNYMHLRFLAYPLTLLLLLFTPLFVRILALFGRASALLPIVVGCLVLVACLTVRSIIPMWQSNMSLWSWVYKQYPSYAVGAVNLLIANTRAGNYQRVVAVGEPLLERELGSGRALVYFALAKSYFQLGDIDKMESYYERIFTEFDSGQLKSNLYSQIYTSLAESLLIVRPEDPVIGGLLDLSLSFQQHNGLARVLKGVVAYHEGDFELSINNIHDGLRYMGKTDISMVEVFLQNIGVLTEMKAHGLMFPL